MKLIPSEVVKRSFNVLSWNRLKMQRTNIRKIVKREDLHQSFCNQLNAIAKWLILVLQRRVITFCLLY